MKLFKKLAINVHSQVEAMADRFENREAISNAYIREYERVVAKAKVQLAQVENEVGRLEKESSQMHEEIEIWADRARRVHKTDKQKALECVARMTQIQNNRNKIQDDLKDTKSLRTKMTLDVGHILKKLEVLKRKHQSLSGRQACAEAVHTLHHTDNSLEHDIDDLFARWETDVVAEELHTQSPAATSDQLAEEFEGVEQEQALQQVLDQIISAPKSEKEK